MSGPATRNGCHRPTAMRHGLVILLCGPVVWSLALLPWLNGCGPPADRKSATSTLARWEDRRQADGDSLARMITDQDAHVRRAAVRVAGLIGRDDVLPQLLEALGDRSSSVRQEAAFALGLLGDPQAVPALISASRSDHRGLRLAALEGLAHLEHDGEAFVDPALTGDIPEAIRAWDGLRDRAAAMDHARLVATLQAGLSRSETEVLWRALRCAERCPDSTLVAQIAPFALEDAVQVRVHALRALAHQEGLSALRAVLASGEQRLRFPRSETVRVQVALMRALGKLAATILGQSEEATFAGEISRLTALLTTGVHHANPHVARLALAAMAQAVAELPLPPEAAERESLLPVWRIRMVQAAEDRLQDPVAAVRAASVSAIFALRGEGALPAFGIAMSDSSGWVQAAAVHALAGLAPTERNVLMLNAVLWSPERTSLVRTAAVEAAGRIWGRCAADSLRPLREYQGIRSRIFQLLHEAVADSNFTVVATAAPLLGAFHCGTALDALLTAYAAASGEGQADVRLAVLEALPAVLTGEAQQANAATWRELILPCWQAAADDSATAFQPDLADSLLQSLVTIGPALIQRAVRVCEEAFDDPDQRIRLRGRQVAVATGILPDNLVPSTASLEATLPPHHRDPAQPALAMPFSAPKVRCSTARGSFVIQLDGQHAPNTVANFLNLIARGFYDDATFHRVVPDFVIQGGDPRGDGWGGPGYTLRSEWSRLPFVRGTVGIAHAGKDTGGSQFFVTQSPQPHLNGRYTVFGQVVDGMDVVDEIQPGDSFRVAVLP